MSIYEAFRKKVPDEKIGGIENIDPKNTWVWVEGYKGTDKNMKCNGFQYELGKQHDMPEDAEIVECSSGFHLCRDLEDVFHYYSVGNGNRFFKVKALVRMEDYANYGVISPSRLMSNHKLVSKSILFISELTADEILSAHPKVDKDKLSIWTTDIKKLAIECSIDAAVMRWQTEELVKLGYSMPFAEFVAWEQGYAIAAAVGSQTDLSMDMKAMFILESLRTRSIQRDMTAKITLPDIGGSRARGRRT